MISTANSWADAAAASVDATISPTRWNPSSKPGHSSKKGFHHPSNGLVVSFVHLRLHGVTVKMRKTPPKLQIDLIPMIKEKPTGSICQISGMLKNGTLAVFYKVFC